jgi:hypothetical protein
MRGVYYFQFIQSFPHVDHTFGDVFEICFHLDQFQIRCVGILHVQLGDGFDQVHLLLIPDTTLSFT